MAEELTFGDDVGDFTGRLRRKLMAVVGADSAAEIAMKTGLDRRRAAAILAGDIPDSYELILLERGYRQAIWPR